MRLFVGLPLFVAGTAWMAWAGQAVVILTAAAAYVVSSASLPGREPRLLASAPLAEVRIDAKRGVCGVGSERLWPLPLRPAPLRELARLVPGATEPAAAPASRGRRRRWLIVLGVVVGLLVVLVVIGAVTETDEEKIEETILGYNEALVDGDGEALCARLTNRAREQVVEATTAAVGAPPDPPDCATAVEAVHERNRGVVRRVVRR